MLVQGSGNVIWNVKKVEETEESIIIAYSKNTYLDGRIKFDKQNENFQLFAVANDCDEFESKRLFQFLYALIIQNTLSFQVYSIRIG